MFDLFYNSTKPNIFPHEKYAETIEQALVLSKTKFFWWVHGENDYTDFNFDFVPSPWEEKYRHVWVDEKNIGRLTFLVNTRGLIPFRDFYHKDLPVREKIDWTPWVIPDDIDRKSFDFTWKHDIGDPPYIYQFGTQWQKTGGPRYIVPGAENIKYIDYPKAKKLTNNKDRWTLLDSVDIDQFDYTWHPDDTEPPFIYIFGTKEIKAEKREVARYTVPGATQIKYMDDPIKLKVDYLLWDIPNDIDVESFDFTWEPPLHDPPYIYQFPSQWRKTGGPRYKVPGATEIKFMQHPTATRKQMFDEWVIPDDIDRDSFDFSWQPNEYELPYIFQFPSQWRKNGGPKHIGSGGTEIKYMTGPIAKRKPQYDNWDIPEDIDRDSFDFSWQPSEHELAYIFQFPTRWRKNGGPRYISPGATQIKYLDSPVAKRLPNLKDWVIPDEIDKNTFDFSWQPSEHDPPLIYQFGTQWQKTGGPQYVPYGVQEMKYIENIKAKRLPTFDNWDIPEDVDKSSFDFSWHPDDTSPPYIYQFPNQWRRDAGPRYVVPGAKETVYLKDPVAKRKHIYDNWDIPKDIDRDSFDFSWQPDEYDSPYIYQFGTQWQKTGGPRYVAPGATEIKYVELPKANRLKVYDNWDIPEDVDKSSFDFSWHPDESSPPYIYQFPTQWQKTGGPRYVAPGATEIKYVELPKAKKVLRSKEHWILSNDADGEIFDYSWHPDDTEPPYIYIFGSTAVEPDILEMARYTVPGATDKKYVTEIKIKYKVNKDNWKYDKELVDEDSIDFRWRPHPYEPPLIYQFGTQWQKTGGPRYVVPGATEVKCCNDFVARRLPNKKYWHLDPTVDYSTFDFSWHPDESQRQYKHIFGTQWQDVTNTFYYEGTAETPPVNYIKDFRITSGSSYLPRYYIETNLDDLVKEHPIERFWALSKTINYDKFDFTWHPDISQFDYVHVFGTEWQKDSQTYLINGPAYTSGKKELNYVGAVKAEAQITADIFYIDKLNYKSIDRFKKLKEKFPAIQKTRLINGLLETIKRCAIKATTERFWIITSDIEYNNFNFSWHPSSWQRHMTHVFGSKIQPWSETMLILRDDFLKSLRWCKTLKDFPNLNFVNDQYIDIPSDFYDKFFISRTEKETGTFRKIKNRFSDIRYINGSKDIHEAYLEASKQAKTDMFWVVDSDSEIDNEFEFKYPVPTWDNEYVHVFKQNEKYAGVYLIPKKKEITRKETKYRFFKNYKTLDVVASHYRPWDIFFISYNEPNAELNWNKLKQRFPTATRINNIKGIYNAHRLAAEMSGTKMFYVVDGDAEILDSYDFNLTVPNWDNDSVYVWHSKNPINGLEYGYGGVKLLPKDKVLELDFKGTDMTTSISEKFNIIKEVSNITAFNTDEFSTWKSAFRECVKLTTGLVRQDNEETKERLRIWCEVGADQKYGIWAIRGANDGKEYASNTDNDLTLINNFEWLREFYGKKYNT